MARTPGGRAALHVGLRLISVAAGFAACVLEWIALRRYLYLSQRGLERANWTAAFVAAPSLDGYCRLFRLRRARERQ